MHAYIYEGLARERQREADTSARDARIARALRAATKAQRATRIAKIATERALLPAR